MNPSGDIFGSIVRMRIVQSNICVAQQIDEVNVDGSTCLLAITAHSSSFSIRLNNLAGIRRAPCPRAWMRRPISGIGPVPSRSHRSKLAALRTSEEPPSGRLTQYDPMSGISPPRR